MVKQRAKKFKKKNLLNSNPKDAIQLRHSSLRLVPFVKVKMATTKRRKALEIVRAPRSTIGGLRIRYRE